MSVRANSTGQPVRLQRRAGQWRLVVTELVSVDEQLLRPERREVLASVEVLSALARSYPPETVRDARALMDQADDGTERAFELVGRGWAPAPARPSQRPLSRGDVTAMLEDLGRHIEILRGLHESLLARVVALESAGTPARPREAPTHVVARVPSRREMMNALAGAKSAPASIASEVPDDSAPRPAALAPAPAAAPEPPAPAAVAEPAGAAEDTSATDPAVTKIGLPGPKDVTECLLMLGIKDVTLISDRTRVPAELAGFHVSPLVDDAGTTVGAIMLDRRAGVELAGDLLGLVSAAREEQAEQGFSTDTLDALNEIANNVGGLVNRANQKTHVKVSRLEPARPDELAWLATASRRLGVLTRKDGNFWLVAR